MTGIIIAKYNNGCAQITMPNAAYIKANKKSRKQVVVNAISCFCLGFCAKNLLFWQHFTTVLKYNGDYAVIFGSYEKCVAKSEGT